MFIDIHSHAYRFPGPPNPKTNAQWFSTPKQLLERYHELDIERGILLPIVNSEVYLPQSNDDIIEMAEESNGKFIPFCNVDPRAITNSADAPLDVLLRFYSSRGCRGIGEVMPNLYFLDPRVQNLFRHAEALQMPVTFDISVRIGGNYGLVDDVGLPQLEESLKRFPGLKIFGHGPAFWAEIGRLETPSDRDGYPDYRISEGIVPKLLRRYKNLYGDLSAGSGYNALARDPDYAAIFIDEFQDKLLYGTDICAPDQKAPLASYLTHLRDEGKISDNAFVKVARENAVRVLGL